MLFSLSLYLSRSISLSFLLYIYLLLSCLCSTQQAAPRASHRIGRLRQQTRIAVPRRTADLVAAGRQQPQDRVSVHTDIQ